MRHVVEINPRTWETIQELLREGRYESLPQFIAVAIANQLQLEVTPIDQTMEASPSVKSSATEPAIHPMVGTPAVLRAPVEEPTLVQSREGASNEIIWGLYNRIFPVKITVRVLAHLLVSKGSKSVDLRSLREESVLHARNIGKELVQADRTRGSGRGGKLATGLPIRKGDKSLDRFKNMFVGTMSNQGKIGGYPAILRFLLFQRVNDSAQVSLTPAGYAFAGLKNPILDNGREAVDGTLSISESDFYMTHIQHDLPHEWELCHRIIESIPDGSDTPDAVDQIIRRNVPGLKPTMVAPTRAGIISRLDELGLVQRRQDGLHVSYALTKRGELFLKSAQKVATNR